MSQYYSGMYQDTGINNYRQNLLRGNRQNQLSYRAPPAPSRRNPSSFLNNLNMGGSYRAPPAPPRRNTRPVESNRFQPRGGYQDPIYGIPRMPPGMPDPFYPPRQQFPQLPSPGRKGQSNRPQPGGYYPQPPSSPNYPGGGFPSPGRKGNNSGYQQPSYQQPRTPFGYGQTLNMSNRFGGSSVPQNTYGFQNPHYQPYKTDGFIEGSTDPNFNAVQDSSRSIGSIGSDGLYTNQAEPYVTSILGPQALQPNAGGGDGSYTNLVEPSGGGGGYVWDKSNSNGGGGLYDDLSPNMSALGGTQASPEAMQEMERSYQAMLRGDGQTYGMATQDGGLNSPGRKGNTMPSPNQSQPGMGFGGGFNRSSNYPGKGGMGGGFNASGNNMLQNTGGKGTMMGGGKTAFPEQNILSSYLS